MSFQAPSSEIYGEPKIIRAGLLKKFKKGFLSKGFKVVYAELTDDSCLIWYKDQCSYKRDGTVFLSNICDFLAVGPYTRSIPGRPNLPKGTSERHVIAVPCMPRRDSTVHWFLCFNDNELNEWMTSISSVLPPLPPPKDPPPENNDIKDPPPPYPDDGCVKETNASSQPAAAAAEEEEEEYGSKNHERAVRYQVKETNGKAEAFHNDGLVVASAVNGAVISSWGWTWGWGGGWGCGGWGCFDFGPCDHQTENNSLGLRNGDVNNQYGMSDDSCRNGQTSSSAHNNEYDASDQPGYDYDQADIDGGCDAVCDGGGFDAGGFDAGGFDLGFSIGF